MPSKSLLLELPERQSLDAIALTEVFLFSRAGGYDDALTSG
jgi:hypothetical protein